LFFLLVSLKARRCIWRYWNSRATRLVQLSHATEFLYLAHNALIFLVGLWCISSNTEEIRVVSGGLCLNPLQSFLSFLVATVAGVWKLGEHVFSSVFYELLGLGSRSFTGTRSVTTVESWMTAVITLFLN
jgi:hypothetical protein